MANATLDGPARGASWAAQSNSHSGAVIMSQSVISSVEEYRLLIEGDLLELIRQAIALEQAARDSEQYSERRADLEHQLYDLYEEIGWSVVYDLKECPF